MTLKLALPSNKELYGKSVEFFENTGIDISAKGRSLRASITGLQNATALLQRSADIPNNVDNGNVDLGIVGLDRYLESADPSGDSAIIIPDLGFAECKLEIAVPEVWIDVTSIYDVADLSVIFRRQGDELRIATKYPNLTQNFLYEHGINYFTLVAAAGAMEAAPLMGYADAITDIVETGNTMRENHLKVLTDGTILESKAVLIGNTSSLSKIDSEDGSFSELLSIFKKSSIKYEEILKASNNDGKER
tara:strand:- start:5143 stop:5886 length:744 start_codon:yes stop_codon:yes gene_type:complete